MRYRFFEEVATGAQHRAKMRASVGLACEYLLEQANRTIPHEYGTLERSASTDVEETPDGVRGCVSYDTPYAVSQHEHLEFHHDPGRRAKWLELTAEEQQGAIGRIVAKGMSGGTYGTRW